MLISGNFHSGPVSTIRFVGYVGLALFMPLLIGIAVYAWRLIKRAKGTPYFFLALFLGSPMVYTPFLFVFIFGAFQNDFVGVIINLGFLKLLDSSMKESEQDLAPRPISPNPPSRRLVGPARLMPVGQR